MSTISVKSYEDVHNTFAKTFTISGLLHQTCFSILTGYTNGSADIMFILRTCISVLGFCTIASMVPHIARDARLKYGNTLIISDSDSDDFMNDLGTRPTRNGSVNSLRKPLTNFASAANTKNKSDSITAWATLQISSVLLASCFYFTFSLNSEESCI